jgi:hypothetical protein
LRFFVARSTRVKFANSVAKFSDPKTCMVVSRPLYLDMRLGSHDQKSLTSGACERHIVEQTLN